ncbi:MAG: dihydropteroate synthase [Thermodesulfobacteriota bacterium]
MQLTLKDKSLEFGKRALIMGILNVTPDSFSDGGRFVGQEAVETQVKAMLASGVDIIDVGGESTRPFSEPVPPEEELTRVLPAIASIRRLAPGTAISIDTTKAAVAEASLAAGADIINDVSALRYDPAMVEVAMARQAPVVIMHMQGTPRDMQVEPAYSDVVREIIDFLAERIAWAEAQGLGRDRILVDPGLGFGKTVTHNLCILKHLAELKQLGCPLLIGHSRKAFIGKILDLPVENRDCATASIAAYCAMQGADIIRVHDVEQSRQAIRMAEAIMAAP